MEVVLLEDVSNLGQLGDVVRVKRGYARNFLIPKGKARKATAASLRMIEEKREELEAICQAKLTAAEKIKDTLDGLSLKIYQHAGMDGRLYGSVTTHKIVKELAALGHEVPKGSVRLAEGPFRSVGTYTVQVVLHSKVAVSIELVISPEAQV